MITELNECNINIFSQENENARILGYYDLISTSEKLVNDKRLLIPDTFQTNAENRVAALSHQIKVASNSNPQLGFDEFGSVKVLTREHLPILRGGFQKFDEEGNHFYFDKPVYIFRKTESGFEEL